MALDRTPLGFIVRPPDSKNLTTVTVGGVKFRVWKEAAPAIKRFLTFLNNVEPFSEPGWDGGYAYRKVANSEKWSEHAAGTAFDMNASQHPRGAGQRNAGWSATQLRVIRWYLRTSPTGRLFRWGNDYTTTPDSMHFELKSPAALEAYNKKYPLKKKL